MTIKLKLSSEQEQRLRAGAAQQDAEVVREILRQAVDSMVDELLRTSARLPEAKSLHVLLDKIATELRGVPALSDEAVSRAGIYAERP